MLRKFASEQEIASGRQLMDRYGVLAVFIGGVTPIPDFLLAYLAGMTQMALIPFLLSDGTARLLQERACRLGVSGRWAMSSISSAGAR